MRKKFAPYVGHVIRHMCSSPNALSTVSNGRCQNS